MDKKIKISLSTIIIIVAFIIICILAVLLFISNKNNKENDDKEKNNNTTSAISESSNNVENEEKNNINNTNKEEDEENKKRIIDVNSPEGIYIFKYLHKVWMWPEIYEENMPEFDNIKEATKDYLTACAYVSVDTRDQGDNIYEYKLPLKRFNDSLVKLFGEDADGLINDADFDDKFYVAKNSDGTYHINGFDGSEISSSHFMVDNIENIDDKYYVTLLEYKSKADAISIDLEEGQEYHEYFYDKEDNLFLTTTNKMEKGEIITLDENGNKIDMKNDYEFDNSDGSLIRFKNDYLLANYKDKLSVRKLDIVYNKNTLSFNLLNNKLK